MSEKIIQAQLTNTYQILRLPTSGWGRS